MPLVHPQFVVLDSATLGKVSRDYWSPDENLRGKARTFVARLRDRSVYVTFTVTHLFETLRHANEAVVRDRIRFLRSLPFVAWLRPYDRAWFPGGPHHLLQRELHAVVHDARRGWRAIRDHVRTDLWETGVGAEIFVDDDRLWSFLRTEAERQRRIEQYVASVARTDPTDLKEVTLEEILRSPERAKSERIAFMRWFAAKMKAQLEQHGDRRLTDAQQTALAFATGTMRRVESFEFAGCDPIHRLLDHFGVPEDILTDNMTVDDLGDLAVYIQQLHLISEDLRPCASVTVHDVPLETLPFYVLQQRLAKVQRKAQRVSGSDLGDSHIAPLVLYADGVEVDKRTFEYLSQVKRACPSLASLMGHFFRSVDYAEIPERCEATRTVVR